MALSVPIYAWTIPPVFLASRAAAGDPGDDFSNNLFTDIAPLLTLFGEQFASQYITESMGWLDHIIFAMCPIGILVAMTAAIRLGGPAWMRAVIGRARESREAVELELMSSRSDAVCELWNGKDIVRTIGELGVQHIIYLEDYKDQGGTCGLFTVREAEKAELIREKKERETSHIPNMALNMDRGHDKIELLEVATYAILLQVGVLVFIGYSVYHPTFSKHFTKDGQPVRRYAYPLFAVGTILLTAGLLLCTAVVEKNADKGEFVAKGPNNTDSAGKTNSGDSPLNARILWLQRNQTVLDQSFDASVIFRPPREGSKLLGSILTSRRAITREDRNPIPVPGFRISYNPFEVVTFTGVVLSLCGFISQFQGLRGLNWSASITQLCCVALMTTLRARFRQHLVVTPITQKVPAQHEMDWLALWLTRRRFEDENNQNLLWPTSSNAIDNQLVQPIGEIWGRIVTALLLIYVHFQRSLIYRYLFRPLWYLVGFNSLLYSSLFKFLIQYIPHHPTESFFQLLKELFIQVRTEYFAQPLDTILDLYLTLFPLLYNFQDEYYGEWQAKVTWRILTSPISHPFECSDPVSPIANLSPNEAQTALNIRKRLAQLTEWRGDTADVSVRLAKSICVILSTLLPLETSFSWSLPVEIDGSSVEKIKITFKRESESHWTEIDALLSLWLFHIKENHIRMGQQPSGNDSTNRDNRTIWREPEAGCASSVQNTNQFFRLLGPADADFQRNLSSWIGSDNVRGLQVMTKEELFGTQQQHDFFGSIGFYPGWERSSASHAGFIAVTASESLLYLLAQHLFLSFMWDVAKGLKVNSGIFEGNPVLSDLPAMGTMNPGVLRVSPQLENQTLRLENETLNQLAKNVQETGLCTIDDTLLSIVPALCYHQLLQPWDIAMDFVTKGLRPADVMLQGKWDQVVSICGRLLNKYSGLGAKDPMFLQVTALVLETLHIVVDNLFHLKDQELDSVGTIQLHALQQARASLERILEQQFPRSDSRTLDHFAMLYRFQLRFNPDVWSKFNITEGSLLDTMKDGNQTRDTLHRVYGYFEQPQSFEYLRFISVDEENLQMEMRKVKRHLLPGYSAAEWRDVLGWTPLHYVVRSGDLEAMKAWYHLNGKSGVKLPDVSGKTPFYNACEGFGSIDENHSFNEAQDVIQPLISAEDSKIQARDGRYMLHHAAITGNYLICQLLLQYQADVEVEDGFRQRPIHLAAFGGSSVVLNCLLNVGANVEAQDSWGRTAQHLAALRGHGNVIQQLHEASHSLIEVNDEAGRTPLFLAALGGHVDVTEQLLQLQREDDEQERDCNGRTPMHLAAVRGHSDVVARLVLLRGSWMRVQDEDGRTPLHLAALEGHGNVIRQLQLQCEDEVQERDHNGRTPIHLAALRGHSDVVTQLVLLRGSWMWAQDEDGRTPLHLAALEGHELVTEELLKLSRGQISRIQDHHWETALELAKLKGHSKIVEILDGFDRGRDEGGEELSS